MIDNVEGYCHENAYTSKSITEQFQACVECWSFMWPFHKVNLLWNERLRLWNNGMWWSVSEAHDMKRFILKGKRRRHGWNPSAPTKEEKRRERKNERKSFHRYQFGAAFLLVLLSWVAGRKMQKIGSWENRIIHLPTYTQSPCGHRRRRRA